MVRTYATALLLAALSLAGVSAQTGPSGATPSATTPSTAGVSETDLATYLRSLDPNLTTSQGENGSTLYKMTVNRDGWNYKLQVESNKAAIWLIVDLGKLRGEPEEMKAESFAALLQANFLLGPTHFALEKGASGYNLTAARSLDRPVSLDRVKSSLELLLKQVRSSHSVWSPLTATN